MHGEERHEESERRHEETSVADNTAADAGSDSNNILYDILVYREWPKTALEPYDTISANRRLSFSGLNDVASNEENGETSSTYKWFRSFWPFSWFSPSSVKGLPPKVKCLFDQRIAWKFSLSDDGSLLAVLQDHLLEIFSAKDNFTTALGRIRLSQSHEQCNKDPHPSFRLLTWSPDASLLVLTSSHGNVDIYDAYGFHVYSIFSTNVPRKEYFSGTSGVSSQSCGNSYIGAYFTEVRVKSRDWLCELILVDYSGYVNSFLLSPSGFQEYTSFSLTQNYSQFKNCGISAATFSSKHNLLCIASPTSPKARFGKDSAYCVASAYDLTAWRLLNEAPFYAKAISSNNEENPRISWSPFPLFQQYSRMEEAIYAIEESPDGNMLCALHSSGDLSLWHLPSLRLAKKIPLEAQPSYDDINPNLLQNPKMKRKKKMFLKNPLRWMPLSIKWWNAESIVVGRYSGGVSIIKVLGDSNNEEEDFGERGNMLGESSEFFSGPPSFSKCFDNGFFVLECDTFTRSQAKTSINEECGDEGENREDETKNSEIGGVGSSGVEESDDSEDEEEEESGLYVRGKRTLTAVAYLVTESERFAPPRKRPRVMMKSYKLLSLISTTPEELYARKIEMEEYGEALIMAQHYGLDTDQVYDRQWRLSNLSIVAIKDYLEKIKRRSLVLRECLHTVPTDVEAVRELLNYGLGETDLDVLVKMGEKGLTADDAKYIFPHETVQGDDYESYYLSEVEIAARAEHKENQLMDRVIWTKLTLGQKDLLATRRVLLKYLHRLESYLAIIEKDDGDFDRNFYMRYREQPILKSAIEFARSGQIKAVATILESYGSDLKNYHLTILSNFPESLSPEEYFDLIPKVDNHNSGKVLLPQHTTLFEKTNFGTSFSNGSKKDWSELEFVKKCIEQKKDESDVLVQENELSASHVDDRGEKTSKGGKGEETVLSRKPNFYFKSNAPSRDLVAKWVDTRVRQIEKQSSLVDHALTLLEISSNNGIRVDPRLHHNLLTLEMMMYDLQHLGPSSAANMVSLKRLEEMSDLEVVDKLMGKSSKSNFLNSVNKILIPYLDRLESLEAGARANLLRNYLLHLSATSLLHPFELIKHGAATTPTSTSSSPNQPGQIFMSAEEYISIGIDCIYAFDANDSRPSPDVDDDDDLTTGHEKKESCEIIMELASYLRKRCRNPHVSAELAEIISMVKAGKILKERYGIVKSLHYFRSSKTQQKQMEDLLVQVTRRAEGKRPKLSGKEWFEVLQDLFELRLAFPVIPLYFCIEVLCESLLCSENTENIRLVEEMFEYSPADALFKGKSSMLYTLSVYKIGTIPQETKVNVVAKACEYYFDSSKDVDDKNLALAKHCLDLVEEGSKESLRSSPNGEKINNPLCKYYSLLSALDMLAEFGVSILPIVLRKAACSLVNLHQVIEKILEVDSTSYKNVKKILKLVRHLNDYRDNFNVGAVSQEERNNKTAEYLQEKENENSTLALVAGHALNEKDYEACFGICEMLMESFPAGNRHAVNACLALANCDEFVDFQDAKSIMASFCVNYCPDDEIEDMLCRRIDLKDDLLMESQPTKVNCLIILGEVLKSN